MSYYRGLRTTASERPSRSYSLNTGWRGRQAEGGKKKFFMNLLGEKSKPAVQDEPKTRTFYRRGITPVGDTPGFSEKKGIWAPQMPALGGMKWAFRLGVLVLLMITVAWSKEKTTAFLQDVAGLKLSKISVEGNHYLGADEITKAVGLPLGENMFKLDIQQANERLKKLDWIQRVFIERRLPSSILVSVRERKPMALLDNGTLYGVDAEGRVLSPSAALLSEDLPLISGLPFQADAVGTTHMAETLRPALDFFAFLKKRDNALADDVSEANLSEKDALKVTFIDGIQATFNPPVTEAELRRMALVLSDLNQKEKRAGTMDFRFRDMVLVKTR